MTDKAKDYGEPLKVIYNGRSLSAIASPSQQRCVAKPPPLPEGRHTFFQDHEPETQLMERMVACTNALVGCPDPKIFMARLRVQQEEIKHIRDNILEDLHQHSIHDDCDTWHYQNMMDSAKRRVDKALDDPALAWLRKEIR